MKRLSFGKINIVWTEKKDGNFKIKENRINLAKKFGFDDIVVPNQKHTNIITTLENIPAESDGIFTDKKYKPIGVLTADCMPIVIFSNNEIAVIHAGWKGLFNGIIENSLNLFKEKNLKAFIGASIRSCCYEVSQDFINSLNISKKFFTISNSKIYLSLQDIAKEKLKNIEIIDTEECTKCSGNYFSYRNKDTEERILTFAWIGD